MSADVSHPFHNNKPSINEILKITSGGKVNDIDIRAPKTSTSQFSNSKSLNESLLGSPDKVSNDQLWKMVEAYNLLKA